MQNLTTFIKNGYNILAKVWLKSYPRVIVHMTDFSYWQLEKHIDRAPITWKENAFKVKY